MFLGGPDDPGLTAARKARDQGDVKTLQTKSPKQKGELVRQSHLRITFALPSCTTICVRQPSRATLTVGEGSGAIGSRRSGDCG